MAHIQGSSPVEAHILVARNHTYKEQRCRAAASLRNVSWRKLGRIERDWLGISEGFTNLLTFFYSHAS